MTADSDVAVVGGGPAGSVAAATLAARGLRVVVLEETGYERPRPGETLPPSAHPVLRRLGVDRALPAIAVPSHGNVSVWGGPEPVALPFLVHPYGDGWHVDRGRFDALLARRARDAGASVRTGVRVTGCTPVAGGWRLAYPGGGLTARALVDATGRVAAVARRAGARKVLLDRLVGVVQRYRGAGAGGPTLVEASPAGWHYSAPVPGGLVVTFMTDADLWRAGSTAWGAALAAAPETSARLAGAVPEGRPRVVSARSHRLDRTGATGDWVAVGDAALAVDPLTSAGLTHALTTGEAGAVALGYALAGRPEPLREYEQRLDVAWRRYGAERAAYYGAEGRWPDEPFWARRRANGAARPRPEPRSASSRAPKPVARPSGRQPSDSASATAAAASTSPLP